MRRRCFCLNSSDPGNDRHLPVNCPVLSAGLEHQYATKILENFRPCTGLVEYAAMSGQATTKSGKARLMSIREVQVQRFSVVTTQPFDTVVARIDQQIGHPDMAAFRKSLSAAQTQAEMENVVQPITQPNGIMEFTRFDLGEVLRKESGASTPRILRIVAGNPLIMKEMVKHVPDAGSYAPVSILIDQRADSVHISYDRMASYLASYGNGDALKVARDLDAKIERIIIEAAK
jgi:uncharacterized protein (DUF302 family)